MQQANARKDAPSGETIGGLSWFYAGEDQETLLGSGGLVATIQFPGVISDPLEWQDSPTGFTCKKAGYYEVAAICSLGSPNAGDTYGLWFKLTTGNLVVSSSEINVGVTGPGREGVNLYVADYFDVGDSILIQGAQYGASGLLSPNAVNSANYLIINPIG